MPQPKHLAGSLVRGKVARSGGHGLEGTGQVALEVALHAFLHHDAAYAVNKASVPAKLHAVRCEALHLQPLFDEIQRVDECLGHKAGKCSASHALAYPSDVAVWVEQQLPEVDEEVVEGKLESRQRPNLQKGGQQAAVEGCRALLPPHAAHRLPYGAVRLGFHLCYEAGADDVEGLRHNGADAARCEAAGEVDAVVPLLPPVGPQARLKMPRQVLPRGELDSTVDDG